MKQDHKALSHENDGKLERFSFFAAGNNSRNPTQSGIIDQFTDKLINDKGWRLKIENVRGLSGQAQDKAKDELPAITPSVCIISGERNAGNTHLNYTSLIQADFDHHHDPQALVSQLKGDPHTRLSFQSVRGKAKAFFKVATVNSRLDHTAAFEAVKLYCKMRGYGEIDDKPKNIVSLCYISHDPTALLKDAQPLQWGAATRTATCCRTRRRVQRHRAKSNRLARQAQHPHPRYKRLPPQRQHSLDVSCTVPVEIRPYHRLRR